MEVLHYHAIHLAKTFAGRSSMPAYAHVQKAVSSKLEIYPTTLL